MSIELVRLDDRLIHGQVVAGWVKALYADSITVIDNDVAQDSFQQDLMRMAVPEGVSVHVHSVADCKNHLEELEVSGQRAIVLFSQVVDINELYLSIGFPSRVLNVGGVRFEDTRERVTDVLFLSKAEIGMLIAMIRDGLTVEFRPTPFDKAINFLDLVNSGQSGSIEALR
ncbi:PTS sugar transporter subunit IIB [bacterium]|nr:PTS sugar transporter subunit IIB [bacterium]